MSKELSFVLPYPANALEPVISSRALEMHFQLARGYAAKTPVIEAGIAAAAESGENALRAQLRDLSFQSSGDVLHRVFFANMRPEQKATEPHDNTLALIKGAFADVAEFKQVFTTAAKAVEGPGWTVLAWHPGYSRLMPLNVEKHNDKSISGAIPVLVLDVWEHAYMLDYGIQRPQWVDAWWKLVNWNDVERRVVAALNGALPMN